MFWLAGCTGPSFHTRTLTLTRWAHVVACFDGTAAREAQGNLSPDRNLSPDGSSRSVLAVAMGMPLPGQ
tara:strand:- start:259 stop:465 length:207 start_codon:yes stop_codon:yes gene_type:complete